MAKKEMSPFETWKFVVPNIKKIIENIKKLTEEFKAASSEQEALKVFKKFGRYTDKVGEEITLVQVLYSIDTTNKKYEKAMNILNEGLPYVSNEQVEFTKAVLSSPFRSYLEKKLGTFLFTMYEYSLKAFDPCILEELIEENNLTMQYDALVASAQIPFRGEIYNLTQMGKFLMDSDRNTRKEAADAYYGYLSSIEDQIEDIFDKLVKNRDRQAKKLGYKDYVELGYIKMNRFDYDREDVAKYREAIRENVTPLANKLMNDQFKRTKIKDPHVYDLGYQFITGNPLPLGTTEEKVEKAKKMYDELSPDTSYFFRFMSDNHLLDLEAKPGKQPGGYMTYFPVHGCPFIFSNFNGTSGDIDVLTHEFGHSFQAYVARNIKIAEYRSPTMESCEIDSMSMEFFAEPWMELFFDEPDKYRYSHLADSICFLPYGVTVDEFQHFVYEHPEATPAERDAFWHSLEEKYTPWKTKAYKGTPYMEKGHRWLTQGHIFSSPFYYIDYTLAQVMAFQFLEANLKDHTKAWKKYMKLCAMGGKYPFRTLVKKDGMKDPFEPGVLKKTIKPLVKILKSYDISKY